jgi:hypothetical protein
MTRFCLALALLGSFATSAFAQEEGHLAKTVDFSKPPAKVEGYNKVRFTVTGEQTPQGLILHVSGQAYYPDGVRLHVLTRYWKSKRYLNRKTPVVKDRAFSVDIGPFPKDIPHGELTVEGWFTLAKQPARVKKAFMDGKFNSCMPPCRFDRLNVTRTAYAMGGAEGQAQSERDEKAKLDEGLRAVLAARSVAELAINEVRKKKSSSEIAKKAVTKLEADLKAALEPLNSWAQGRLFVLFSEEHGKLRGLVHAAQVEAQLHAAVAGVKWVVEGGPRVSTASGRVDPFTRYGRARVEMEKQVEGLKGFLAESGSLDKLWEEVGKEAAARDKAAKERAAKNN